MYRAINLETLMAYQIPIVNYIPITCINNIFTEKILLNITSIDSK